jgi:hypothetical protein
VSPKKNQDAPSCTVLQPTSCPITLPLLKGWGSLQISVTVGCADATAAAAATRSVETSARALGANIGTSWAMGRGDGPSPRAASRIAAARR